MYLSFKSCIFTFTYENHTCELICVCMCVYVYRIGERIELGASHMVEKLSTLSYTPTPFVVLRHISDS